MGDLETDSNDQDAYVQNGSVKYTLNTFDVTLIDPVDEPVVNTTLQWDGYNPWSGTIVNVEADTSAPAGNEHRFVKVTARNTVPLSDEGTANISLSDTPDNATSFAWDRLVLSRRLTGTTIETRAKVALTNAEFAWPGPIFPGAEIAITSAADGLAATVFTIMGWSAWLPQAGVIRYDLDLGLGDYATATTSADDGGPLDPPTFPEYVQDQADVAIDDSLGDGPPVGAIRDAINDSVCPGIVVPWGPTNAQAYIGACYTSKVVGTESGAGDDYQFFDTDGELLSYIEGSALVFVGGHLVPPGDWTATEPENGQFAVGAGYSGPVVMHARVACIAPTPPV